MEKLIMANNATCVATAAKCFVTIRNRTVSGETAHVERWNNTLRQRLARFVRKTLSFSKSDVMHEICLFLFLHRYNDELALSFN
jgi:IS1 family transposase